MSFQPFNFTYTPPLTVSDPVSIAPGLPTTALNTNLDSNVTVNPVVASYINQLSNLSDTATFLSNLILNRYANTGIPIDPAVDPATAQALIGCYGQAPPIVTSTMYANLVACSNTLAAIEQATTGTSSQADQIAVANTTQVINAVNNALLDSNRTQDYQLLTSSLLQTDAALFQGIQSSLSVYPTTVTPSSAVTSTLDSINATYSSIYATLYSALTTVNIVNADLNNLLNATFGQAEADIARIITSLTFVQGMIMKDKGSSVFKTLETGAISSVIPVLSSALFSLDNLVMRAISPLRGITGTLGSVVNSVKQSIAIVDTSNGVNTIKDGSLNGMSLSNPCSQNVLKNYPGVKLPTVPDLGISAGLQAVGHYLALADTKVNSKFATMNENLQKLMLGRGKSYTDFLELTCVLSNIESLISICNQVLNAQSSGLIPPGIPPATSSSQLQSIISNINTNPSIVTSTSGVPSNVLGVLTTGGLSV